MDLNPKFVSVLFLIDANFGFAEPAVSSMDARRRAT